VGAETVDKNKKLKGQKALYDVYDEEEKALLPQYEDEKEKESYRLTGDEDDRTRKAHSIRDRLKKSLPGVCILCLAILRLDIQHAHFNTLIHLIDGYATAAPFIQHCETTVTP
jgi:hypothetical protein